ncbi:MAG: TPM domain-containing protein [Gemmatimonadales bacterium]
MTLRRGVLIAVLAFDVLLLVLLWPVLVGPKERLTDRVGLIPAAEARQYNRYLDWVQHESGVDIRILLVPGTGDTPLETYALEAMRERGIGRETGTRGLLIVYDTSRRAMRVEVGPRLQGVIPDAFAGYLMREHVDAFFGEGRPEIGLRTTLFMVHWRIRMARLGREYDPSFEEFVRDVRRLASGGGASSRIGGAVSSAGFINRAGDSAAHAYFGPQPTAEQAIRRYQEWLALGSGQIDVPLFTPASRDYLRRLPISRAFNEYLLANEYGRAYEIDERGDLAMLVYTDDPFLSPKFLHRETGGWQVDIAAEVANSQEAVGTAWTWRLRDSGDEFSRVFADRYTPMDVFGADEFYRVAGGDNRSLVIRGDADAVESELAHREPHPRSAPGDADAVEHLTVRQVAERIRQVRGRPGIIVLYSSRNGATRAQFTDISRLAADWRSRGIEVLAFHTDDDSSAVAGLRGFLTGYDAPFAPVQVYRWRPGLLAATMGELGIHVGRRWANPLVAVIDPAGRVVWQAQGVTDWSRVQDASRALRP